MTVTLLKYHSLGNDFLVALDPSELPRSGDGSDDLDLDFVVALCDRHRGVGADGLMVARPVEGHWHDLGEGERPELRMELRNADGGRAETSGNGIRCLALALIDSGRVPGPEVVILTDAGRRLVTLDCRAGPGRSGDASDSGVMVKAEMGILEVGEAELPPLLGAPFEARHVDVGNPHLVLMGPSLDGIDIAALGHSLEGARPGGQNVEVVAPAAGGGLDMLVWERGAGLTESCGTGSCAAAAAARASGVAGDSVAVHNPGGTLRVDLSGGALTPRVSLSGPVQRVFRVELEPSEIDVSA